MHTPHPPHPPRFAPRTSDFKCIRVDCVSTRNAFKSRTCRGLYTHVANGIGVYSRVGCSSAKANRQPKWEHACRVTNTLVHPSDACNHRHQYIIIPYADNITTSESKECRGGVLILTIRMKLGGPIRSVLVYTKQRAAHDTCIEPTPQIPTVKACGVYTLALLP